MIQNKYCSAIILAAKIRGKRLHGVISSEHYTILVGTCWFILVILVVSGVITDLGHDLLGIPRLFQANREIARMQTADAEVRRLDILRRKAMQTLEQVGKMNLSAGLLLCIPKRACAHTRTGPPSAPR